MRSFKAAALEGPKDAVAGVRESSGRAARRPRLPENRAVAGAPRAAHARAPPADFPADWRDRESAVRPDCRALGSWISLLPAWGSRVARPGSAITPARSVAARCRPVLDPPRRCVREADLGVCCDTVLNEALIFGAQPPACRPVGIRGSVPPETRGLRRSSRRPRFVLRWKRKSAPWERSGRCRPVGAEVAGHAHQRRDRPTVPEPLGEKLSHPGPGFGCPGKAPRHDPSLVVGPDGPARRVPSEGSQMRIDWPSGRTAIRSLQRKLIFAGKFSHGKAMSCAHISTLHQ